MKLSHVFHLMTVAGYFVLYLVAVVSAQTLSHGFLRLMDVHNSELSVVLENLLSAGMVTLLVLLGCNESRQDLKLSRGSHFIIRGLLIGGGIPIAGLLITFISGNVVLVDYTGSWLKLVYPASVFLLAAWEEEIFFRVLLIRKLNESFSTAHSITISSVLFVLPHLVHVHITWVGALSVLLAGYLFAVAYVKSASIWYPLVMHFVWNIVEGPVCGSAVSGNETSSLFVLEYRGNEWLTGGGYGFEGSIISVALLLVAIVLMRLDGRTPRT